MKCNVCGLENREGNVFCTSCGAQLPPITEPQVENNNFSPNIAAERVFNALNSKLFTAICILLTVSFGASLFAGSFSIITLLAMIFCWLIFSAARRGTADAKQLRHLSGTIFAQYVINFVLAGLFLLIGIIFSALFSLIASNPTLLDQLTATINGLPVDSPILTDLFLSASAVIFFIVFALIAGLIVLFNILAIRKIHLFVKSVYQSILSGEPLFQKVRGAKGWLLALGIISALSLPATLSSGEMLAAISTAAGSATSIIGYLLIKNNFND